MQMIAEVRDAVLQVLLLVRLHFRGWACSSSRRIRCAADALLEIMTLFVQATVTFLFVLANRRRSAPPGTDWRGRIQDLSSMWDQKSQLDFAPSAIPTNALADTATLHGRSHASCDRRMSLPYSGAAPTKLCADARHGLSTAKCCPSWLLATSGRRSACRCHRPRYHRCNLPSPGCVTQTFFLVRPPSRHAGQICKVAFRQGRHVFCSKSSKTVWAPVCKFLRHDRQPRRRLLMILSPAPSGRRSSPSQADKH